MREHEFAVLILALGNLHLRWASLPQIVQDKVEHRIDRVSRHLTSRSLATLLQGMAGMDCAWSDLGRNTTTALQASLLLGGEGDEKGLPADAEAPLTASQRWRGLQGMSGHEAATTLRSLASMQVYWAQLPVDMQSMLLSAANATCLTDRVGAVTTSSSALCALLKMGCREERLPVQLLSTARNNLLALDRQLQDRAPLQEQQREDLLLLLEAHSHLFGQKVAEAGHETGWGVARERAVRLLCELLHPPQKLIAPAPAPASSTSFGLPLTDEQTLYEQQRRAWLEILNLARPSTADKGSDTDTNSADASSNPGEHTVARVVAALDRLGCRWGELDETAASVVLQVLTSAHERRVQGDLTMGTAERWLRQLSLSVLAMRERERVMVQAESGRVEL
jgi:hypothetical protein